MRRFSANDGPPTVSNARALHQKWPEARETSVPKPTDIDMASRKTTEKPPDAQSSVLKGLAGVPEARETSAPPTDIDVLSERTKEKSPDAQISALKAHSGMRTHYTP